MNVLIVGATGETGRALINACLTAGHQVTATSRTADSLNRVGEINVISGDIRDQNIAIRAVSGNDAVLCALGAPAKESVSDIRSAGTRSLLQAMQQQGVGRLIAISTAGVKDSYKDMTGFARWFYPKVIGKKRLNEAEIQEQLIKQSSVKWTLVRPPRLISECNPAPLYVGNEKRISFSSSLQRTALAEFMVYALIDNHYISKALTVTNR